MTRPLKYIAVALASLWLAACSFIQPLDPQQDIANPNWTTQALYSQYSEWKNVRYRRGGLSKSGVDCSGFVYLTFDSRFDIQLPRSSTQQVLLGRPIPQRELMAGDLVFFRTGKYQRHVGIYLESRKFLHASTERGVMISSLDDRYWSRAYWTAKRVRG
jgi:cell wall-associated NlpC family hydrolase